MKRTALKCPEHVNCVVVLESIPEDELNGRGALRLADPYHWWLVTHKEAVLAIEHNEVPAEEGDVVQDRAVYSSLLERVNDQERRLTQIEEFITRKPRWKKAWDKEVGTIG